MGIEALALVGIATWPAWWALVSVLFTVVHTVEESDPVTGPIWSYLGITSVPVVGMLLLLGFAGLQTALAGMGFGGGSAVALGLLAGIRLLDLVASHLVPAFVLGRRPNPGLLSSPLYLIDALVALLVLWG
jgi:hypothetical protein